MDIGKFKSSPVRLALWILIPPLVIVGVGLSSHALKLQSEWKLNRTKGLSDVLPTLIQTQRKSSELIREFEGSGVLKNEDELISYLQNVAYETGFTVDELTVDRRRAPENNGGIQILVANIKGSASFKAIEKFLSDATSTQHLLYESSLRFNHNPKGAYTQKDYKANITFELILFDTLAQGGGNQ